MNCQNKNIDRWNNKKNYSNESHDNTDFTQQEYNADIKHNNLSPYMVYGGIALLIFYMLKKK